MKEQKVSLPEPMPTAYPNGMCWCGCGERVSSPTKFFVSNHDRAAEARVVREVYGSIPNFLLAHGYGPPQDPNIQRMLKTMDAARRRPA